MATITEDYVSFETAKLLKEKNFDGVCRAGYTSHGILNILEVKEYLTNQTCPDTYWNCVAPTLQMAMKWLREVHDLHIMVNCIGKVNYDPIVQRFDGKDFEIEGVEVGTTRRINGKWENVRRGFKTNEEACEAAIKYCLEHLI